MSRSYYNASPTRPVTVTPGSPPPSVINRSWPRTQPRTRRIPILPPARTQTQLHRVANDGLTSTQLYSSLSRERHISGREFSICRHTGSLRCLFGMLISFGIVGMKTFRSALRCIARSRSRGLRGSLIPCPTTSRVLSRCVSTLTSHHLPNLLFSL